MALVDHSNYASLRRALDGAYDQAATGKGRDRHVSTPGQRFEDQPILTLQRAFGPGYALGQAGKKMEESQRMDTDAAVAELRGAIVYLAAAIIRREEMQREHDRAHAEQPAFAPDTSEVGHG